MLNFIFLQAATAANGTAYDEAVTKLERLVVEYMIDSLSFGTSDDAAKYGAWTDSVKSLYATLNSEGKVTGYVWKPVGSYKGETYDGVDVSATAFVAVPRVCRQTFKTGHTVIAFDLGKYF